MAPQSFQRTSREKTPQVFARALIVRRQENLLTGPALKLLAPLVVIPMVLVLWQGTRGFSLSSPVWAAASGLSPQMTLEQSADQRQAEARRLLDQAERQPVVMAQQLRLQAQEKFREAGNFHLELAARYFTTRKFVDHMWASAMSFVAGRDPRRAAAALKAYLRNEPLQRRPEALFALGKSLLTLGKLEESLRHFEQCIEEYPQHPLTYQARFWGSKAQGELGQADAAERLLESNLADPNLTAASLEWRESLFALGQLLYAEGRYERASEKLQDFVRRYPESEDNAQAFYLLAQCFRQQAGELDRPLNQANPGRQRELLQQSLDDAKEVEQILGGRVAEELSEFQQAMLRNASLLQCDLLIALGSQEQAALKTREVGKRYAASVVEAEALARAAAVYRETGSHDAAKSTLEKARAVWSNLPIEEIERFSRFSREQWLDLVDSQLRWKNFKF